MDEQTLWDKFADLRRKIAYKEMDILIGKVPSGFFRIYGKYSVSYLTSALKDEYWFVREKVTAALETMSEPAISYLVSECTYENLDKPQIAEALGIIAKKHPEYNWKDIVLHLIDCLTHEESSIQSWASQALGEITRSVFVEIDKTGVLKLIEALEEDDSDVRNRAAFMLINTNNVIAVPLLINHLKNLDWSVRNRIYDAVEKSIKEMIRNENYPGALNRIKKVTHAIMKLYEEKKDRYSLLERREILAGLSDFTQQIHDKMNPDKKKFHKPVKHQPVRVVKRKVIANG